MYLKELKKNVAWEALKYISPNTIVGVGTGSTIFYFIEALSTIKHLINGVVSSSQASTILLRKKGIKVLPLNDFSSVPIYIDSADEINYDMQMIKGGGAALTGEKIISAMSEKFICIVDQSKVVHTLGQFPLPIEVIPISYSYIFREIIKMGGRPEYRKNVITDNGNIIIDIHDLNINDPISMEKKINSLAGVVTVGLFSIRTADVMLVSSYDGIKKILKSKNNKC